MGNIALTRRQTDINIYAMGKFIPRELDSKWHDAMGSRENKFG